ncbi:UDP-glucose/GDP-mannose dehydrogenase family protein [Candidatus Sumerlaeota bacterium]|nr:UDP-glucose/GDP-mannose dehydrogenase family protein [Candidatus Sumerlaeota bacterium]
MNVAVIGTGYVGLVTGTVFADLGNDVTCVDKDAEKVAQLQAGRPTIYEPGLEEMLAHNLANGRLTFTSEIEEAVKKSTVVFIAVGTPPLPNGESDLSQVEEAARSIARALDHYTIIVNKSTVPVGTGDFVRRTVEANRRRKIDFDVVSNPEFLKEGSAIADSLNPDRIVIGAPSQSVAMALLELYAPLERPMLITDVESAEMIKYASNAFLATKISFINAVADLCEKTGADIAQVAKGMGYDSRIGSAFLQAGLGFGGSCFPKDTLSLMHTFQRYDEENKLLKAVIDINNDRVPRFCRRIEKRLGSLAGKTLGVLGLSFKPNTDDLREAKSLEIIRFLLKGGAKVRAYDPVAVPGAKVVLVKEGDAVTFCESAYEVAENAEAIVVITEWNEFKLLNLERIKKSVKEPIIFDGRNIYAPQRLKSLGFEYYSIGRGTNP